MKRAWKRIVVCIPLLATLLISPNQLAGCGPFFDTALFSFTTRPDPPIENFLSGKLGVIEPTYRYRFLFAAYRQLAGVPFDKNEQAAIVALDGFVTERQDPRYEASKSPAIAQWTEVRAKVVPGDKPKIEPTARQDYAVWPNCQDDAFRAAAHTLDDRIGKFGATNKDVREWVNGQDVVFANCPQQRLTLPVPLDSNASSWLRADRAYQVAAATFYNGQYDEAYKQFQAIASDRSSPWSTPAAYLSARCKVRKALEHVADPNVKPDMPPLGEAESMLKSILTDPAQKPMHSAAESLLGFVEFRLHPDERGEELAATLMKPHGGEHFRQDLHDYTLLLDVTEPDDDMSDWIRTLNREGQARRDAVSAASPAPGQKVAPNHHALDKWHEMKSLPWLVAALMLEPAGSPAAAELRAAATKVPPSSPAYLTAQYHAVRLAAQGGDTGPARKELDTLASSEMPASAANLFQEQRARIAPTFAAFLKEAQLKPVGVLSGEGGNETADVPTEGGGIYFDVYAAETLNKRTPLALMSDAVKDTGLAPPLRRKLAMAAWTRAVLLQDSERADELAQIVSSAEPSLAKEMASFREAKGEAKQFQGVWILLRHPGMRPFVEPGNPSRSDQPEERDAFRDNWWCGDVGAHAAVETRGNEPDCSGLSDCPNSDPDPNFPFAAWASDQDRSAARREWEALRKVGTAPKYLGEQTIAWVKAHGDDPRAPEALAQVVTATHYGCSTKETTPISKAAFTLLHQRYPTSEWAKRTKYYY